jgi:hypothetical protein
MVSTLARDQSTWPRSPSRSRTRRWSWSNTPALAHSVSRRQQVAGEPQPSSRAGSSRHGVEVRAMYTIAAKQLRSGTTRRRPPYGGRGGAGSNGSTIAHNWSGTRSSTRFGMTRKPAIPSRKERNSVLEGVSPPLAMGRAAELSQRIAAFTEGHASTQAVIVRPAAEPVLTAATSRWDRGRPGRGAQAFSQSG